MTARFFSLSLLILLFFIPARAATIAGRVVNTKGEGIAYAFVFTEGRKVAAQCNDAGFFSLKVTHGEHRLTAQCAGYTTQTITAQAGDTNLVITLKSGNVLDMLTVTATQTPKTLANTPVVTRIITGDEVRRLEATNIRDVLENELPGIEFTYSMNQQVVINMHGMGGMSVLFLVDGERLAGETLDNIDFSRLNTDNIERIEIIKGAATALYGSNAVGAVVNIITKSQQEPLSAQLNARLGSRYGQYRYGGNVGFTKGKWSNVFNAQTDGMESYMVYDKDGDSTLIYGNRQWNFKDKAVFNINDRSSLTARAGYYFHERDASELMNDRARAFSGGLRYENNSPDGNKLMISYNFERYDKSDFYTQTSREYLDYKNVQNTVRTIYSHIVSSDLSLSAGGDMMNDYLMSYQFADNDNHHQQQTADLFAQADWEPGLHWNMVAGLRLDYFSLYGAELTPKAAVMYKNGNYRLRGSYSKGFRAPTLKEMYMDFNMANIFTIYGNKELQSEVSHCFSLSAEYVRKHFSATLTGYYNRLSNEIGTVWDASLEGGRGAMVYRNVEGTDLGTVDLSLLCKLDGGLTGKLNYTYFHEFPHNEGYNLSDTRPHSIILQLMYEKSWKNYELAVSLNGRWLSKVDYYTLNSSSTGAYDSYAPYTSPGYTLWKISVSQKFWKHFTLSLMVDNLLNYVPTRYEYNLPYTLGRSYLAAITIDLFK